MKPAFLAIALALSAAAYAQAPSAPPGAWTLSVQAAPDRKDVCPGGAGEVELVKMKDKFVAQFSSDVAALATKQVKVQGFMMPLEMGDKQTTSSSRPCRKAASFCMPGGPEQLVEVRTKTPVKYTFDPVVLTGKLAVLKDDPTGVFYRLTDAQASN
jgi:hypothetical protein